MEEGRKKQIEDMAEQIGEGFIFNYEVDPYSILDEYKIRVFHRDYGEAFEGLIWKWNGSFNMHVNTRRVESLYSFKGRSTAAHELGHYSIPEHLERLNNGNSISFRGNNSCGALTDPYEQEAECFATNLLLPKSYFTSVSSDLPFGFEAILKLQLMFNTSLCSTAIRYTTLSVAPCMLVLSEHLGNIKKWVSPSLNKLIGPNWQMKLNPKRSIVGIQRKQGSRTKMNYWSGYTLMGNWFLNMDPNNKNGIVYEETLRNKTFTLTLIRVFCK